MIDMLYPARLYMCISVVRHTFFHETCKMRWLALSPSSAQHHAVRVGRQGSRMRVHVGELAGQRLRRALGAFLKLQKALMASALPCASAAAARTIQATNSGSQ